MKIYQLYQEAYARNDNTIMVALETEPHLIVEAYDKHHQENDEGLGDIRLLKGWYVNVWESGKIVGLLIVDELRVSAEQAAGGGEEQG